jgi:O-antigen ligase
LALGNRSRFTALLFPVLLAICLLLTSTTQLTESLWHYDFKRLLQLYLLTGMLLWVLLIPSLRNAFQNQVNRFPRWLALVLTVMFALGVISAWYNRAPGLGLAYSLADVALLFLLIAAALAIAACRSLAGEWFDRILIVLIAMLGVAVGMQELIGVLAAWNLGLEFNFESSLVYFAFPRFYNQVQSWTIPVLAALPLVFPRQRLAIFLCVLALSLNWFVLVETGGRGSALGVTCALIVTALLSPLARKTYLKFQVLGLLLGLLLFGAIALLHAQRDPVDSPTDGNVESAQVDAPAQKELSLNAGDGSFAGAVTGKRIATSSGRIRMWRGCWEDAKSHPFLGIGPMNYACKGPGFRAAHPHNFPLQFLAEWGFPAFVLLLICGIYLALRLIVNLKEASTTHNKSDYLVVALGTGIMAAAIHACFSGILIMPASQMAGILVTGWFLGVLPVSGAYTRSRRLAGLFLLIGLVVSTALSLFGTAQAPSNFQRYQAMDKPDRLLPRFWQYGKDCRLDYQDQQ